METENTNMQLSSEDDGDWLNCQRCLGRIMQVGPADTYGSMQNAALRHFCPENSSTGTRIHRIAREARGTAYNAVVFALGGVVMTLAALVALGVVAAGEHTPDDLRSAWAGVIFCLWILVGNVIRCRRYSDRMDWLKDTPLWWTRLDEAPTLLMFPKATRWARRVLARGKALNYDHE